MNPDDHLYSGLLHPHWQMSHAERMAMSHLLGLLRPKVAIEVGTYQGGSLSLIAAHSGWVYSLDIDPTIPKKFSQFRNTTFITESSATSLPALLTRLETEGAPLEFILIDGDHSREGVRRDLDTVLRYQPARRVHVLLHDSFNPECRAGMLAANWAEARHVAFADLDFIHGKIVQQGGPFDGELWGGLALLVLEPAVQPVCQPQQTSGNMQRVCAGGGALAATVQAPDPDALLSESQSPGEFVDACYRLFLKREPDAPGRQHFLGCLKQGQPRLQVINQFLASPEFKDRDPARQWVPPGHFYSPWPSTQEVAEHKARPQASAPFPAVDLQDAAQEKLMNVFAGLYPSVPFQDEAVPGLRYRYINSSYPAGDAIPLHCMIRHLQPKRMIEVGCGNSSCVMMDTNEHFLGGRMEQTSIEPYPEFFLSLLSPADKERLRLIECKLQDVPLDTFDQLEANDILFIDSTHVSKLNSDVNHCFFQVLPRLKRGVFIHIHDVFHPFEYPTPWLEEGRAWSEIYLLRAFLQYNDAFQIRFHNTYLYQKHRPWFEKHMPKCLSQPGGSIWLEKVK